MSQCRSTYLDVLVVEPAYPPAYPRLIHSGSPTRGSQTGPKNGGCDAGTTDAADASWSHNPFMVAIIHCRSVFATLLASSCWTKVASIISKRLRAVWLPAGSILGQVVLSRVWFGRRWQYNRTQADIKCYLFNLETRRESLTEGVAGSALGRQSIGWRNRYGVGGRIVGDRPGQDTKKPGSRRRT